MLLPVLGNLRKEPLSTPSRCLIRLAATRALLIFQNTLVWSRDSSVWWNYTETGEACFIEPDHLRVILWKKLCWLPITGHVTYDRSALSRRVATWATMCCRSRTAIASFDTTDRRTVFAETRLASRYTPPPVLSLSRAHPP